MIARSTLLALALVSASAGVAAADGWVDCNGPDKRGRGCNTSGRDSAATAFGLGLVGAVAFSIGRRRRGRS